MLECTIPSFFLFKKIYGNFFNKNPALFIFLSLFLGFLSVFLGIPSLLIPLIFFLGFLSFPRLLIAFFLISLSFFYGHFLYQFPSPNDLGKIGSGEVVLSSIEENNRFQEGYRMKGTLKRFSLDKKTIVTRNLPISFFLSKKNAPSFHSFPKKALVQGVLKKNHKGKYDFRIEKFETKPQTIPSFFPIRSSYKKSLHQFFKKTLGENINAHFLESLITGDCYDQELFVLFDRFSMQHLLVISGFHFSLLSSLIYAFFSLFFGFRLSLFFSSCILSVYYLFVGPFPAVTRAFLMFFLREIGLLFGKNAKPLNSLGVAGVLILIMNPFNCLDMGFHLSFGITASLILFSSWTAEILEPFFLKRTKETLLKMSLFTQHGYLILQVFGSCIALSLAASFFALPVSIFLFQKISIWGFIYNLFFPFFVSFILLSVFISLFLAYIVPFLGQSMLLLSAFFSKLLLQIPSSLPLKADLSLSFPSFPLWFLEIYLILLFLTGIIRLNKK